MDGAPHFGPWLRRRLVERQMSLAQLCRTAGCDYTYLWRILNADPSRGRRYSRPSYDLTRRIGEALDSPREALTAAGYGEYSALESARIEDQVARLESDLAALRTALPGVRDAHSIPSRRLPRLGAVRAGPLSEALENPDGWEEMPETVARGADFTVEVRGDSMLPTLMDGDVVCVRVSPTAQPGQLVVAAVEGDGFTVKRYDVEGGVPVLRADNREWEPVVFRPGMRVVGVVTGLFRPPEVLHRRPR